MSNIAFQGLSAADWIKRLQSGSVDERTNAIEALRAMAWEDLDDAELHQAAIALAENTHHADVGLRVRAYGAIGVICKVLAHDLVNLGNPQKAAVTLRKLLLESNALHVALLQTAPQMVQHLRTKAALSDEQKKSVEQDIVKKLDLKQANRL